jgi:hypothetical protein
MFVRWQSKKLNKLAYVDGKPIADVHYNSFLAGSFRHPKTKKPVSKHITNLGGIRESDIPALPHRCAFWTSVEDALAPLKLDRDDREKIETSLATRVPKPTDLQLKTHRAEMAAFEKHKDSEKLASAIKAARAKVRK